MVSTECICQSDNELEAFLASLVPDENEMAITALFGGDDALSLDLTVLIEDFPSPFEPAKKKRRRVNRLKCNVEELRKTAEKLETELQLLKQQRQKRSSSQRLHGMTNDELVPPSGSRSRAWRGIAMRQYKRLRDSEMENTRLHLLLNEHVKIGRSLERLIQRGNSKALNLTPPSPLHRLLDTESAFLIQTRRELEQCLQEMYCMVHVAMADPSFNTTEAEFHDLAVGTDGIYAHGMRLVPSTRTTITRMIWDLLSDRRVTAPPRQYHSACEHDALSEIVSKCFVLNWDHLGQMTTYLGTFVGHRHREAGRDTIVYSANFANTADGLSSDCPSLRLYGWGQITSVAKLSTKVLFKSVARVNSTPIGCELHERLSQLGHAILLGHHERRQRAIDEALLSFHDTSA